jgi:hypothetical protein
MRAGMQRSISVVDDGFERGATAGRTSAAA